MHIIYLLKCYKKWLINQIVFHIADMLSKCMQGMNNLEATVFSGADKSVMASSRFQSDIKALSKVSAARNLTYQHQHNKQMRCRAIYQLLSNTLYHKRFFPCYVFNVLGGLDNEPMLLEIRGEPRSFELTGDLGANEVDIVALINGQSEQMPHLLETSEPERIRKTGKCNLRKSLAWNSAFFESPGVLDAEELSSMIEGAEKGKTHLLPGIEEDISTSTESISTIK